MEANKRSLFVLFLKNLIRRLKFFKSRQDATFLLLKVNTVSTEFDTLYLHIRYIGAYNTLTHR